MKNIFFKKMNQNENILLYDYKNNLFSLDDLEAANLSPIKGYKKIKPDSSVLNDKNGHIKKNNSQIFIKTNNIKKPLNKINFNIIKDKNDKSYNNKSFNKIIQKEIILNNSIDLISQNKKNIKIPKIPINKTKNNYYININNNIQNVLKPKEENKIKNIHISLKKIKLGNQRSLSKNLSPKSRNIETFIYKSPKRQNSLYTDRNNFNNDISEDMTNTSYYNSKLLSRVNLSAKKNNLIPRPNLKHEIIKRNKYRQKKIDKKLLDQSQEIKMKFKKENEIIRKKNEFFHKYGILPEHKIKYENKAIKIQKQFRKFLKIKKISSSKDKYSKTKICRVNEIILNPNIEFNLNNNKKLLTNSKYILKYLLIKKEQKRQNILRLFFEKYKNETIKNNSVKQKSNDENGINNNIFNLRTNKLKDLVQKKMAQNKEKILRYFLKYYYNSLYINFNWFIYLLNQVINYPKSDIYNTSNFMNNKKLFSYFSSDKNSQIESIKEQNYLPIHFINLKETMKKMNNTNSEELKQFYLRDIIRTMNKINEEKEKIEKYKNWKKLAFILSSKIKSILIKVNMGFYYKLLFKLKIENENQRSKTN